MVFPGNFKAVNQGNPDVLKAVINTCSVPENEPLLVKNFSVTCTMHVHGLDDLIPQDLLSHLHLLNCFIATKAGGRGCDQCGAFHFWS